VIMMYGLELRLLTNGKHNQVKQSQIAGFEVTGVKQATRFGVLVKYNIGLI
jgi:hypothetical protein